MFKSYIPEHDPLPGFSVFVKSRLRARLCIWYNTRMNYYKRHWDETRGDQYDSWGDSTYYFEVDESDNPVRQIEVYESGKVLRYSTLHPTDEFGALADQFDRAEFASYGITKEEFEKIWNG